jgi:hypothetical protein
VLVVILELPLKFLGLASGNDCINALGPFGGKLWTVLGTRLDNGGVDDPWQHSSMEES